MRGHWLPALRLWITALLGTLVVQGCSKPEPPLPPPHALDDAAAASQRASEAMAEQQSVPKNK